MAKKGSMKGKPVSRAVIGGVIPKPVMTGGYGGVYHGSSGIVPSHLTMGNMMKHSLQKIRKIGYV
jgi:hypothetical protein